MTQGLAGYTGTRFPTSNIGFNEAQYLAANPQVAAMVQQGLYPSGRAHYETVGRLQGLSPLAGGNAGQTVAAGLQRYQNSLGLPSAIFGNTPTPGASNAPPPAASAADAAGASGGIGAMATPVGNGGSGAGGGGDGRGGYGDPGNAGDASKGTGIGGRAGTVGGIAGSLAGIGLGLPGLGLAGAAFGTAMDVAAANNTLGQRDMSKANNPTVGYWDALKDSLSLGLGWGMSSRSQAERALEQQREYDRAAARSPNQTAELDAALNAREDQLRDVAENVDAAKGLAAAQAQQSRNAQAQEAIEQASQDSLATSMASRAGPGVGVNAENDPGYSGPGGGRDSGGRDGNDRGGDSNTDHDPGNASGGFIRALYAMGGLAKPGGYADGGSSNLAPWDRVNADTDRQGLAAWTPYEVSPASAKDELGYAGGGLSLQPGSNPIHAAQGTQVAGPGDGRSDNVPAMLSADEYVIPADVVAALGDGSSNAGAKVLADLVVSTREGYRRKLGSLPPPKA